MTKTPVVQEDPVLVERARVKGIFIEASALGLPEAGLELIDNGTPLEAAIKRLRGDAEARRVDPKFAAIRKRQGECPWESFEEAAKKLGIEDYK